MFLPVVDYAPAFAYNTNRERDDQRIPTIAYTVKRGDNFQ
jgi:hypothetical protein